MDEPVDIRDCMEGLRFPATKQQVVAFVRAHCASQFVSRLLERIPNKLYQSPDDVASELTTID